MIMPVVADFAVETTVFGSKSGLIGVAKMRWNVSFVELC